MRVVETFPRAVRTIEHVWIPLADGTRLAARVWLPADAETAPVPAILEYLPYRKRDFTRARDEPMHHYLAGHGYGCVRVDVRGTGDSDGILTDEYTAAEHDDALEVIAWLAAQPWCSGSVGMMGISWGGFNALQVAARRPPALRAIMTVCASDDRYADDAHYMGGCVLNENLTWGSVLLQFAACPPDPAIVGPAWRAQWIRRLEHAVPFPAVWLRHQRRDAFWRHGSVAEDYAQIVCPVYAIGGWADGYSNAIPRLLAGLRVPRKGLVGPWAHLYPHQGLPGPPIGFLQEALRWWDEWLKGIDTGIMREPMYRVWMQTAVPPRPSVSTRPGRWVAEVTWPSPRTRWRQWALNAGTLDDTPRRGAPLQHRSLETTGLGAGDWCAFGGEGEMPTDQRRDDGTSVTFTSAPLATPLEVLGAPVVDLLLAVDRPVGLVAVRLNDVAPDGASLRVSYGLLNLTHRGGHETPAPLEPGRPTRVQVCLNDVAHAFPIGHRLRVAVSTAYWPIAWPAPAATTMTLYPGTSTLALPERPRDSADEHLRSFDEPEQAPALDHRPIRSGRFRRTYERDLATNETVYTIENEEPEFEGAAVVRLPAVDLELAHAVLRRYRIAEGDPLTARAEVEQRTTFHRTGWEVRVSSRSELRATAEAFRLRVSLVAEADGEVVCAREWDERIPRDLV